MPSSNFMDMGLSSSQPLPSFGSPSPLSPSPLQPLSPSTPMQPYIPSAKAGARRYVNTFSSSPSINRNMSQSLSSPVLPSMSNNNSNGMNAETPLQKSDNTNNNYSQSPSASQFWDSPFQAGN